MKNYITTYHSSLCVTVATGSNYFGLDLSRILATPEKPENFMLNCRRFTDEREKLIEALKVAIRPRNLVEEMLKPEANATKSAIQAKLLEVN